MPKQKNWLWCGFAQICRPTRSGSGTTKASRQVLPLIRTLLGPLVCGLQARLRTFPENDSLGTRGDEMVCIQSGGQKRRIQVSLDRANATTTVMPTLRKWFIHARSTAMTPLREFTVACGDFDQGAARTCNGALQMVYQHPWSPKTHTCAVAFLPTLVGELFGADRLAQRDNLMHHAPMHALAMRSELAFFGGFPPPGSPCSVSSGAPVCLATWDALAHRSAQG